jgi:hypothetical protein
VLDQFLDVTFGGLGENAVPPRFVIERAPVVLADIRLVTDNFVML